jgi:hypothetical protein
MNRSGARSTAIEVLQGSCERSYHDAEKRNAVHSTNLSADSPWKDQALAASSILGTLPNFSLGLPCCSPMCFSAASILCH